MQQNSACAGKNRIHIYFTTLCARFQLNFTDSRRFQAAFSGKTKGFSRNLGKSSLEARLRTRRVTGRDASLPAPLLTASLGLVGRGTVGALPQTPQGTLSLDPARGNCPLTPFRDWVGRTFMLLPRAAFLVFCCQQKTGDAAKRPRSKYSIIAAQCLPLPVPRGCRAAASQSSAGR